MEEIKLKVIREPRLEYNAINTPDKAVEMIQDLIGDFDREYFVMVNIDNQGIPINYNIVSIGNEKGAFVSLQNVIKSALLSNCNNIIVFHNHPSGNLNPSREDINLTNRLNAACKLMNISLLDHIIVSSNDYFSFKQEGIIQNLDDMQVKDELFIKAEKINLNENQLENEIMKKNEEKTDGEDEDIEDLAKDFFLNF